MWSCIILKPNVTALLLSLSSNCTTQFGQVYHSHQTFIRHLTSLQTETEECASGAAARSYPNICSVERFLLSLSLLHSLSLAEIRTHGPASADCLSARPSPPPPLLPSPNRRTADSCRRSPANSRVGGHRSLENYTGH